MFWEPDKLGTAVHEWRKSQGMSQLDMAQVVGISRNYLSQIERGEATNLSLDVYRAICELIGLPEGKPADSVNSLFVDILSAYGSLASDFGVNPFQQLMAWRRRYTAVTGHYLNPLKDKF